ncbi:LAFE_0H01684g1_1 [Lachancea fermentati]|uniref:LAFE_0H01684g1_1 n=1 Tax=Lachancea fermentati TaxID=4955 RepID=A0A1G4MJ60_LACFM|nr:LAFE_0H01684g1_1 [Lachancea fermentati]
MGDSLEDLRSKIIASMGSNNGENNGQNTARFQPSKPSMSNSSKPAQRRDTRGSQSVERRRGDENRSRYGGNSRNYGESRYQSGGRQRIQQNRYYEKKSLPPRRRRDEVDWETVVSIDQRVRMRPTRWDKPPSGFEKVPAERAKLSGLFPLPGQPQDLDETKLEGIVSSGVLTRRTRILFEDPTQTNMALTRSNRRLVITSVDQEFNSDEKVVLQLTEFVKEIDASQELISHLWLQSNRLMLELSSEEMATIVLSCQKFIENKMQRKFIWQRPGEFVGKKKVDDPICGTDVVAILDTGAENETTAKNILQDHQVAYKWMRLITIGSEKESTGTILFEPQGPTESVQELKIIKPNESKLNQDFEEITFQNLPRLVTRPDHEASKVILLLNCVDPLDLKNEEFVSEIRDSMENSSRIHALGEVESVKIPVPRADYRVSFETIGENVGKIYIKFKELDSAKKAMQQLPGSKFNGRTVLCTYFSERDYNMGVL